MVASSFCVASPAKARRSASTPSTSPCSEARCDGYRPRRSNRPSVNSSRLRIQRPLTPSLNATMKSPGASVTVSSLERRVLEQA